MRRPWRRHTRRVGALRRDEQGVEVIEFAIVSFSQAYLGWALGLAGQRQEALTILEDFERRQSQEYVGGFLLAQVSWG